MFPKGGLQMDSYGNSKEGEVYFLLGSGESGEASQRWNYLSWNLDWWTSGGVEKSSLLEIHE